MAQPVPDLRRVRLAHQLLTGRKGRSVQDVVRHLLAVQAQDGRGARLAVRARTRGLVAADVDEALSRGELVVSWLNRGTLHLVAAEDYWWLHPLTTPQLRTANTRRLGQEGVSRAQAAKAIDVILSALAEGPQVRESLRRRLDGAGIPTAGQALVHILFLATLEGLILRGPMIGSEQAFVSVAEWLGPPPSPVSRPEALLRLAARYLAGHTPADPSDLAKWAGISISDARLALAGGRPEALPARGLPRPVLLGPFDPLLLGWSSRSSFVGGHHNVVTTNGVFRPVGLVEGRVVASWSMPGGVLTLSPLEPISAADLAALSSDAQDVLRYLGRPEKPMAVKSARSTEGPDGD